MFIRFTMALAAIVLCTLTSVASAAEMQAKVYPVKDFSELIIAGNAVVEITQDGSEYLRIEADADVLQHIRVDLEEARLTIRVNGTGGTLSWLTGNQQVRVVVRLKQLEALGLSGAAHGRIGELKGQDFQLTASGASKVEFASLNIDDLHLNLSGASEALIDKVQSKKQSFELSGASSLDIKSESHAQEVYIQVSGASHAYAKRLTAQHAELKATGASDIKVSVSEKLTANASGASSINYYGNPQAKINSTGASDVKAHSADK